MTTIENPTADQLEAGGTISGTFRDLPFTDWPLRASEDGFLCAGDALNVRFPGGNIRVDFTITSYTPPDPKPWWETCDDDALVEYDAFPGGSRIVEPARLIRLMTSPSDRHLRRVHVTDYDATVPVPRDALDKLRSRWDSGEGCSTAVYEILQAVDAAAGK